MCFANKEGKCLILILPNLLNKCEGEENCKFCKTSDQVKEEREKSKKRIESLPLDKKEKIYNTYNFKE